MLIFLLKNSRNSNNIINIRLEFAEAEARIIVQI